ncbi:polyprenyl synthetase family protein [Cellulomonas sp. PhB143]|uniref:polyprenyl synthetase family protein n=1 Tax=Cellulomonas sp. PhB143 TaxID=2485186 RepID=UPI000F498D72|nr:polyprenyl synthetase family protein [Cellulomonas sp. PhB143]ROS76722.1 heptaprenyl diphosphate synthase [Cellulomonas sp. PhB143]
MTPAPRAAAATFSLVDPELSARVADRLEEVEARLRETVTQADELADAASRHLVVAGGKRLRPSLTLLASELGTPGPDVVEAAVGVELTHLATLYHDDVMDSAPARRGVPSAHEVWGNSVAILVGDLLFARASRTIATLGPEAVVIQADTFERLCLGQLHETVGPPPGADPVAHYLQVLADKTASLLATSARLGAMFAGCPRDVVETVAAYGEKLGVAFQLADDVLDLTSSAQESGKTPGTDLRERVPTMPVLLLRRRVAAGGSDAADRALVGALDGDLSDDAALDDVVQRLRAHEVLVETRSQAVAWSAAAVDELAALPPGAVKDSMVTFAEALADRAS